MKKIIMIIVLAFVSFANIPGNILAGDNKGHAVFNNRSNLERSSFSKASAIKKQSFLLPVQFDENNVVIKFAALSDIHIQGTNSVPSQKLAVALEQLNNKANGNLDALLVTGDLTDYGLPEQVTELKRIFDNSKIDFHKTRFVFAMGNHEYYNHQLKGAAWNGGYLFKDVFSDEVYQGATNQEIKDGNYHTVVNGYDFIAINCVQYDGGVKYADSDIAWLKDQLRISATERPGKPIFVGSHPNITGTNLGSNEGDYWAGSDLYSILKNYPQVIYFCGHLHFPEHDERSIWQGDFTTIGVGSVYYSSNHPIDDDNKNHFIDVVNGFETADARKTSQGLFVEVDKNNNVKIIRMDFANNEDIKEPWLIPAPQGDKSHLLYYTPEREAEIFGKNPPVFPEGSFVKELSKNVRLNQYQFEFTQAKDSDLVYSYQVSFIDKATGNVIKTISTLSDFYLHAKPDEMPNKLTKTIYGADSVLAPFGLSYKKDYLIKVVAVNCFGKKSEPIFSDVIKGVHQQEGRIELPGKIMLIQNYLNPFNPGAPIRYSIKKLGMVSLKIYALTDREAATSLNQYSNREDYVANFDATNLYYYKIESDYYRDVKKMVVLK